MPGTPVMGDYTAAEIAAMSAAEIEAAQDRDFRKPSKEEPQPASPPLPAEDVWAIRKRQRGNEFVAPSGQRCLLRKVGPETLLEAGILDQVTRLEGLADELVKSAEGAPPTAKRVPTREEFGELLHVINTIVPLAVEQPRIYADGAFNERPDDEPEDVIYVSDIDLADRVAIMEEALKGIRALDRFRHP